MSHTGGIIVVGCFGPHLPPPSGKFFTRISGCFTKWGISYHFFQGSSEDFSAPSHYTSGSCHFYQSDFGNLYFDLFQVLTSKYLWDATTRLRCSSGAEVSSKYGCFSVLRDNLISFPVLSDQGSVTMELSLPTAISTGFIILQLGMIYTNSDFQRRVLVATFKFPVSPDPFAVRESANEAAIASFLLQKRIVGENVPVSGFRSLPYFFQSMQRAMSLTEINRLRQAPLFEVLLWLYPRMIALDTKTEEIPCEGESFGAGSVFLFHTTEKVYIWIGMEANREYLARVFGSDDVRCVPELETEENRYVRGRIQECYALSRRFLPVEVIQQGEPREELIGKLLVAAPKPILR
jgi:hypothetical protein